MIRSHSLRFKLTAAFLLVAVVGILAVGLLANRATAVSFRHYLNQDNAAQWEELIAQLGTIYRRQGGWTDPSAVTSLLSQNRPGRGLGQGQGQGNGSLILLDESGQEVTMAGSRGNRVLTLDTADHVWPIEVAGETVGQLLVFEPGEGGAAAQQFLTEVNQALWLGGGLSVLAAVLLGAWLAHRLTRPLQQLIQATHALAAGDLSHQVPLSSTDELGELAASFNQMVGTLSTAEQQRQQLLADVAHELRTPLSIMRGHMEAMLDGIFPLSADNLALVHEETLLLGRLVDDLRMLSLAESGHLPLQLETVNLAALVQQVAAAFEPLAEADGMRLETAVPSDLPPLTADPGRLQQVLFNLVANALRHARQGNTPPAQVCLRVTPHPDFLEVSVRDNGPGLSADAQAHVFDRFWRADTSRSRDQGGSGLGLAICQALVVAHNGRIWVESTPNQGATFIFTLPLTP